MITKKNLHYLTLISLLSFNSAIARADPDTRSTCGTVTPILSVADVNANGSVDTDDLSLIRSAIKKEQYIALYDFDTNGIIDDKDIIIAQSQLGQESLKVDQALSLLYNRNRRFQFIESAVELRAMGYDGIPPSFAGHGEHWADAINPLSGDPLRPEGINVPQAYDRVSGMYWGINATPVFEYGANDYPTPGGVWETQRVVSFKESAPNYFDSPNEKWHKHGALCITVDTQGTKDSFNAFQYMTYAQCKSLPSTIKDPNTGENFWFNAYMLHAWIFELNPNGVFANTHPCVDPNTLQESTINGDREVPPFFQDY